MTAAGRVFIACVLGACSCTLRAQPHEVPPELWDRPRTAAVILADVGIKRAVGSLLAQPEARLVVRHAAGQEALVQAEELKSWLGALAIDTGRIALRSDLAAGTAITIEVIP